MKTNKSTATILTVCIVLVGILGFTVNNLKSENNSLKDKVEYRTSELTEYQEETGIIEENTHVGKLEFDLEYEDRTSWYRSPIMKDTYLEKRDGNNIIVGKTFRNYKDMSVVSVLIEDKKFQKDIKDQIVGEGYRNVKNDITDHEMPKSGESRSQKWSYEIYKKGNSYQAFASYDDHFVRVIYESIEKTTLDKVNDVIWSLSWDDDMEEEIDSEKLYG